MTGDATLATVGLHMFASWGHSSSSEKDRLVHFFSSYVLIESYEGFYTISSTKHKEVGCLILHLKLG